MSRKVLIDAAFASDVADCLESEGYAFSARSIRAALNEPEPADVAALRADVEIGKLVRRKLTSGNAIPVDRCSICAVEVANIDAAMGKS